VNCPTTLSECECFSSIGGSESLHHRWLHKQTNIISAPRPSKLRLSSTAPTSTAQHCHHNKATLLTHQFCTSNYLLIVRSNAMVTTRRVELGRKSYMLKRAEEAATIPSSDSALPASKDRFKKSFPCFHEGRQWRDHDRNTDLMALAVMDEFPAEVCDYKNNCAHVRSPSLTIPRLLPKSFDSTQKPPTSPIFGLQTRTKRFRTTIPQSRPRELPGR
jgi:hypothetical protein